MKPESKLNFPKPRCDAKLLTLPIERQEQILEWIETPKSETCVGGLRFAREQLAADGLKVSNRALSEFWSYWRREDRFASAKNTAAHVEARLLELAPDIDPERLRKIGQTVFTAESIAEGDGAAFVALESLQLARESAESKGQIEREKLALSKQKHRRQTCKDFLDWYADMRAVKIAEGAGTNEQKIEALGRAMFDDWEES